jgi:hypothetical protein
MKHVHPRARHHVYLRALAVIHVSAGIPGGLYSVQAGANQCACRQWDEDRQTYLHAVRIIANGRQRSTPMLVSPLNETLGITTR